jgi:hypothetical protein
VGVGAISSLDDFQEGLNGLVNILLETRCRRRLTWALGALLFNSMAMVAKRIICTVAPLAYQKGPETPYLYAIPED